MWIFLAILAFLAGQVYLFRCLGKLDKFQEQQSADEPQKEILSIALSDWAAADSVTRILESFSGCCPNVEIMLLTGQDVWEAVQSGRAAVGFLPDTGSVRHKNADMTVVTVKTVPQQRIIWRQSSRSGPENDFVEYLRQQAVVEILNDL